MPSQVLQSRVRLKKLLNWLVFYEVILLVGLTYLAVRIRNLGLNINTTSGIMGTILLYTFPVIWMVCLSLFGAWSVEIFKDHVIGYQRLITSSFITFLFFCSASYLFKIQLSRFVILLSLGGGTVLHLMLRWTFLRISDRMLRTKLANAGWLLIGSDAEIEKSIANFASKGGKSISNMALPINPYDFEAWAESVVNRIVKENFDRIYLLGSNVLSPERLQQLIWRIGELRADLYIPDSLGLAAMQSKLKFVGGIPYSILAAPKIDDSHRMLKRSLDLFLVFPIIVLFLPFFIVISIAVKLTSKGPVFYTQKRIGKDDRLFTFPKFRTMYTGSDQKRLEILGRPDEDMAQRYKSDPRITKFGRFLRRYSLDETPQFFCVLIGTMSMVGPRPMLQEEEPQLNGVSFRRHIAKPGLTGLWQVSGRKNTTWEERMAFDVQYVQNWSIAVDLILMMKTFNSIISGEGSY